MPNIEYLDLSDNLLTEVFPLCQLTRLRELRLAGNLLYAGEEPDLEPSPIPLNLSQSPSSWSPSIPGHSSVDSPSVAVKRYGGLRSRKEVVYMEQSSLASSEEDKKHTDEFVRRIRNENKQQVKNHDEDSENYIAPKKNRDTDRDSCSGVDNNLTFIS
ncbi:unnamed protein product [Protopolystoma xenopodis]|uniref:Uncharacterized protein n=1 Tax=Protopolystoma xenopodis TaxID=117903 RepID=A0A448X2Z1_9PLAT|nr:unnamed protein product [Protopolystoma xenopodis]